MVYYDSINIGSRVEFLKNDKICSGVVRYKGGVVDRGGVWLGIEANDSVGDNDGRILGRRYFQCKNSHGIFLTANEVRFARNNSMRKSVNPYKKIGSKSDCDDVLFKKHGNLYIEYSCITPDYLEKAKTCFEPVYSMYTPFPRHVTHDSVLRDRMKSAKNKPKEETKPAKKDNELFHSVSSIPLVHIPDDELKIYAKSWPKNVSLTRHSNLNNTYDSLTKQMWNHI